MKLPSLLAPAIVLAALALVVAPSFADEELLPEATISLGRDPAPPSCVEVPGGILTITWDIEHETTPNYVLYELWDPSQTILIESETYPGNSGITVTRYWECPEGAIEGKYWVRVEYWSYQAGNEANAEVTFYVCSGTGSICAQKWEDVDCSGDISTPDVVIPGWWLCITTPFGDTFCLPTDDTGTVCWDGLLLGNYTVSEIMQPGYIVVLPPGGVHQVTLSAGTPDAFVTFLNRPEDSPSPAEDSSWGKLKSIFR
ncbi:MAG: hypothetical protein FJY75_06280 [Candidatus Eisenbacteria bacterium]|uniref:Fibronectin type III domain-containing protein n=1 Tax=Eiseniibacteriota bacterium TaxID=2212470 RepID=A0A937XCK5_UNCEI|nr:hypothetical protein [Candidatus Eisenbacteria bacterium]